MSDSEFFQLVRTQNRPESIRYTPDPHFDLRPPIQLTNVASMVQAETVNMRVSKCIVSAYMLSYMDTMTPIEPDVQIQCGDGAVIHTYVVMLVSESPVFASMLSGTFAESNTRMISTEFTEPTMRALVAWLQHNTLPSDPSAELIEAAHYYDMTALMAALSNTTEPDQSSASAEAADEAIQSTASAEAADEASQSTASDQAAEVAGVQGVADPCCVFIPLYVVFSPKAIGSHGRDTSCLWVWEMRMDRYTTRHWLASLDNMRAVLRTLRCAECADGAFGSWRFRGAPNEPLCMSIEDILDKRFTRVIAPADRDAFSDAWMRAIDTINKNFLLALDD